MEHQQRRSLALKILPIWLACAVVILAATPAAAEFVFSRTALTIYPINPPEELAKMQASRQPYILTDKPIKLAAELRPSSSFQSPSIYLTQTLTGNAAYLIPLPPLPKSEKRDGKETPSPTQHRLQPANVYAPVDVLAIDAQGFILQIWPKLNFSKLTQAVMLPEAAHAVLYLAAGRAAELGITPHDRVENELFTAPPESLQ